VGRHVTASGAARHAVPREDRAHGRRRPG